MANLHDGYILTSLGEEMGNGWVWLRIIANGGEWANFANGFGGFVLVEKTNQHEWEGELKRVQ
jgi:hypothetical protein